MSNQTLHSGWLTLDSIMQTYTHACVCAHAHTHQEKIMQKSRNMQLKIVS